MSKNKTIITDNDGRDFINSIENDKRRADSLILLDLFKSVTGFDSKMYGPTIIGFGKYRYKYQSGHEGEAPLAAFSPRKDAIVLYFESDFDDRESLLVKLGKFKTSKVCIYVKKIEDIDLGILTTMIENSIARTKLRFPEQ